DLLDSDTVLVEFSLGPQASYAWALTRDAVHGAALPPGREITAAARALYDAVAASPRARGPAACGKRGECGWPARAAALRRLVLDPLQPYLTRPRVAIVADGMLQYVPFAALLPRHEVVMLPSGSALKLLRASVPAPVTRSGTVAVFADPVFE